jgi:hypothetical protein
MLLALSSQILLLSAGAQQKPALKRPLPYRPTSADQEFKTEKLTAPITFPEVPLYTGQSKFLSGLRYPNDTTGRRMTMTVGVMEEPNQILDWYRQSLKLYKWTIVPQSPESQQVSAVKDGNTFSVMINPSRTAGCRTVVVLNYKYAK